MAKKILLLDISHLFFRAFYAFPRNLTDPQKKPINAVFGVAQMILSVIENEKPDYIFGAKDLAKKTLRAEKMEAYKGQRPEMESDLREQIPRIYEMLAALGLPVFEQEGYEADDVIASLAEKYRHSHDYIVDILTGDADSFQLIGENVCVLKPAKGGNERFDREYLFEKKQLYPGEIADFKAIAGDSADNLKGIAGIGEKGATQLIRTHGSLENIYSALEKGSIHGAIAKKLAEGKEIAFFTKEMALLHRDLEFSSFAIADGLCSNFSVDAACQFFATLGSQSLQKRVIDVLGSAEHTILPVAEKESSSPNILHTKEVSQAQLF